MLTIGLVLVMGLSSSRKRREREEWARKDAAWLASLSPEARARVVREREVALRHAWWVLLVLFLAFVIGMFVVTTIFPLPAGSSKPASSSSVGPKNLGPVKPGPVLP